MLDGHDCLLSCMKDNLTWPVIDHNIESTVNKCKDYQLICPAPPAAPLQPLSWPAQPWSYLHLDFAGPSLNYMFLVIIDTHTKWPEAIPSHRATSQLTEQSSVILASLTLLSQTMEHALLAVNFNSFYQQMVFITGK